MNYHFKLSAGWEKLECQLNSAPINTEKHINNPFDIDFSLHSENSTTK